MKKIVYTLCCNHKNNYIKYYNSTQYFINTKIENFKYISTNNPFIKY